MSFSFLNNCTNIWNVALYWSILTALSTSVSEVEIPALARILSPEIPMFTSFSFVCGRGT